MPGPGHNGGPTMEAGHSWRKQCWTTARARLLPTLPIEVVRLRVRRAAELGLDYKTYAGVRATTGHDIVAFLFSSNALRIRAVSPAMPADRAERLAQVQGCGRLGLITAPLTADMALAANPGLIDAAHPAPAALASWSAARDAIRAALGTIPPDRAVLVGDMTLERDWLSAGRLAAYLPAERFFAAR